MCVAPCVEDHLHEMIKKRTRRLPATNGKVSYSYIRGLIRLLRSLRK